LNVWPNAAEPNATLAAAMTAILPANVIVTASPPRRRKVVPVEVIPFPVQPN
jgi:hypothetical protein